MPPHAPVEMCASDIPIPVILRSKLKDQVNLKATARKNKSTYSNLYHGKIITTMNRNEINSKTNKKIQGEHYFLS